MFQAVGGVVTDCVLDVLVDDGGGVPGQKRTEVSLFPSVNLLQVLPTDLRLIRCVKNRTIAQHIPTGAGSEEEEIISK